MLKNLKSLFIVEEEENDAVKAKETNAETPTPSAKKSTTGRTGSQINANIMEKLLQVIEKNNMEGFDYVEFKKSLKALSKMPMDEKTMFRSAFATAATVGATVNNLIKSVEFYKSVLHKENDTFVKTLNDQVEQKISGREKQVNALKKTIMDKSQQIKRLTEEIDLHQKEISSTMTTIGVDKGKIESTRNDFESTYNNLLSQIDEDLRKINEYLS
ncbi:MAG: hypothetical protein OEX02_03720 [Cyclobacteriaceae bacterium]|nr:hypothetical protein [Cyclobacteriaceae bacterium]